MFLTVSTANPERYPIKPMLLHRRRSWLLFAAIFVLLLSPPALPQSGPATSPTQVRGEVLMLTGELVVVKSAEGTSILIPLGKDTPLDSSLKVGDRVEVVVTSGNHVASVKKLAPDPLR
jgi:hypothetical protein